MSLPEEEDRPPNTPLVLAIEDEPQILRFLRASLVHNGYRLVEATTGEEGLRQAATRTPDVIVLDLGLPGLDGLDVIRRLREWSAVPVVVLSARGQEQDKVTALDAGADDYITKPFGVGELLARLRVALRHATRGSSEEPEPVVEIGSVRIDLARRKVTRDGVDVHLTPIEYKLLTALARYPGRVITHHQLLRQVWGPGSTTQSHYLRVFMAQLRRKLEADPARPRLFLTEPGVGYRLREP
jgi:two-component system, OmpR family, KDP operon response regulator KdpE